MQGGLKWGCKTYLTSSSEEVRYLRHPHIVCDMRLSSGCSTPVDADVLAFLEHSIQPVLPKDFLYTTWKSGKLHKWPLDVDLALAPSHSSILTHRAHLPHITVYHRPKVTLIYTCRFLVIKSFFCSGVRVAGSTAKEAFPFNRMSEAATAILLRCSREAGKSLNFSQNLRSGELIHHLYYTGFFEATCLHHAHI